MPAVTVDCIIYRKNEQNIDEVLLIKRGKEPFKNQWALPGGFIEIDEELEDAARRELFEETGIVQNQLKQLFTIGTVDRDPRHRTIGVIYSGIYESGNNIVRAGDDANEVGWFAIDKLSRLAFDHNEIISKAFLQFLE
jgi:8-oxo-dGTP diphosphatase